MSDYPYAIREISNPKSGSGLQYEVYDPDTGGTIGIFDTEKEARMRAEKMEEIADQEGVDEPDIPRDDPATG
ncbi:hypothetical protein GCM10027040_31710 [Halomonas shantousis]